MAVGNTFGRIFRLTTWGESHGPAIGGVVDGCPAGLALSEADIQQELDLRKPGATTQGATARVEADKVKILSGVFEGQTTGTPIAFEIENTNQRSTDYFNLAEVFRPGHGDFGYFKKYGVRDWRGGGRASGRETASRVAGGAIALVLLKQFGVSLRAFTIEYGGIKAALTDPDGAQSRAFFAPDANIVKDWSARLEKTRAQHDTLGGAVRVEAIGIPAGLGEPVFDKLDALLAHAVMSVGTIKAVEIGTGVEAARTTGRVNNDPMTPPEGFRSNNAGGILGGISTGQTIVVTGWVKPIASIGTEQETVNVRGETAKITIAGRHDISAIPRIVPVLKAMVALTLADAMLLQQAQRSLPQNGN